MDNTSALDSAFLHLDSRTSALHIASLAVFEGPVPSQAQVNAAIARKLPDVPRWRQRLTLVPFALGRPVWVDHPDFDLARHVHRVAVPAPGGEQELRDVASRLLSEPLDREHPLWEDWVLEGLADGRWALLTKVHHTMVDGIAGTDLLGTLLDHEPDPPVSQVTDLWRPATPPSGRQLAVTALRENLALRARELRALPRALASSATTAAGHPVRSASALWSTTRGLAGYVGNLRPTSATSLIGPIGRDRRFDWTEVDLTTVLDIHDRLGGTVNDLVLTAVTSAYRELLLARGERPREDTVRCLVPVSVRRPDERGDFDNRVSAILADLPVHLADPRDRLTEMAIRMRGLKQSHEAEVGEMVTSVADALPAAPTAAFLHVAFRVPHRNLTTVVTNVPGPPGRLYFLGRRMLATYPYVPIADRLRSGIAVTSYDGRLLFGVTTDRDSMPDAHVLVRGITDGFAELAGIETSFPRRA